jgi:hypothetical protein
MPGFPEWESETNYAPDDCVQRRGMKFIAARQHRSGDFEVDYNCSKWKHFILPVLTGDIKIANDLPPGYREGAIKSPRHRFVMGEFALILAAKGHAVDYQTLERLADVAIGDV